MNATLPQNSSASTLINQVWDRIKSYPLTDPLEVGATPLQQGLLKGASLHSLVDRVEQRATLIWSLIPFTLFALVKFPWAAVQVGFSVKDCLKAYDLGERIEKGLEILEALGNMCFAAITTTVAVCQCLGRCTPWLFPLGVVGGVLQSGGLAAGIYGIVKGKRFVKEMDQAYAVSQDEALAWITRQNPGMLKKQFRLQNGNDLIQFAKELLKDPQAHCKDKLLTLLKGRLKNTLRGDAITFAARIVGVVGLPLLLISPPAGLALSGVSTTLHAAVTTRDYFFNDQ